MAEGYAWPRRQQVSVGTADPTGSVGMCFQGNPGKPEKLGTLIYGPQFRVLSGGSKWVQAQPALNAGCVDKAPEDVYNRKAKKGSDSEDTMYIADGWKDYEVIDTGDGEKLERWGDVILRRPDPQAIWPCEDKSAWKQAHAWYHRSASGGGEWEFFRRLPEKWEIDYKNLRFWVRPTGFKHTGLFPEQAVNWDWMGGLIRKAGRPIRVLNLFGYTGGATVACAAAGAHVTHVDAAKGMVQWAGENRQLSGLDEKSTRWIIDDALKFVKREQRRGSFYDGILMDPPSYGRGPGGEIWKLENELYGLVDACAQTLSERPLFMLINSYTTGLQPAVLHNMLEKTVAQAHGGSVSADEVVLPVTLGGVLPCGASGRWQAR